MQTKALFIANRGSVHVDQSLCFIRTVTVQRKLSDVRADFFQIACVRFIKAVRCITVYISTPMTFPSFIIGTTISDLESELQAM